MTSFLDTRAVVHVAVRDQPFLSAHLVEVDAPYGRGDHAVEEDIVNPEKVNLLSIRVHLLDEVRGDDGEEAGAVRERVAGVGEQPALHLPFAGPPNHRVLPDLAVDGVGFDTVAEFIPVSVKELPDVQKNVIVHFNNHFDVFASIGQPAISHDSLEFRKLQ